MKLYHFIIALVIIQCFTGCDRVRSSLGLLTDSQLNELKEGYRSAQRANNTGADTVASGQDSLSLSAIRNGTSTSDAIITTNVQKGLYYIIFGGFKDKDNVRKMSNAVAGIGLQPVSIISESGTMEMVATGPYSSEEEAAKAVAGLPVNFKYDLSEVWVYKAK